MPNGEDGLSAQIEALRARQHLIERYIWIALGGAIVLGLTGGGFLTSLRQDVASVQAKAGEAGSSIDALNERLTKVTRNVEQLDRERLPQIQGAQQAAIGAISIAQSAAATAIAQSHDQSVKNVSDQTTAALSELATAKNAALDEVTRSAEATLTSVADRKLKELGERISATEAIFDGMRDVVVAFNKECPNEWQKFVEAEGRFIIGVGKGDLANSILLGTTGGEEKHSLNTKEIPPHRNAVHVATVNTADTDTLGSVSVVTSLLENHSFSEGRGAPHNNMPPYIGLYFCTYVGHPK